MKKIKYNVESKTLCFDPETHSEKEKPLIVGIVRDYSEENLEIAKREAYNGEYTIEDDGIEEDTTPSQLDIIEAQVTYTAMMTDTLLEV